MLDKMMFLFFNLIKKSIFKINFTSLLLTLIKIPGFNLKKKRTNCNFFIIFNNFSIFNISSMQINCFSHYSKLIVNINIKNFCTNHFAFRNISLKFILFSFFSLKKINQIIIYINWNNLLWNKSRFQLRKAVQAALIFKCHFLFAI